MRGGVGLIWAEKRRSEGHSRRFLQRVRTKRALEELFDLVLVRGLAASCNRRCRRTARVVRVFALVMLRAVCSGQDAGADVCPGAAVERLLLTPNQLRVRVLVEVRRELRRKEVSRGSCSQVRQAYVPSRTGTA